MRGRYWFRRLRHTELKAKMNDDPNPIDERHRLWIESVLLTGRFRRVVEVGCWKGFSTSAFLNALDVGAVDEVHLCDPKPQPELEALIADHPQKDRITLHRMCSVDLLAKDSAFDFVFVDGNHSYRSVSAELRLLIPQRLRLTVWHDTNSVGKYPHCDGPQHALREYQRDGYFVLNDQLVREGERTDRGLAMCVRELDDYAVVWEAYCQTC